MTRPVMLLFFVVAAAFAFHGILIANSHVRIGDLESVQRASVNHIRSDLESRFDMVGVMRTESDDEMWFTPNGRGQVFRCVTPGFGGWNKTTGALVRISGTIDHEKNLLTILDLDNIRVPDTVNHLNWPGKPTDQ